MTLVGGDGGRHPIAKFRTSSFFTANYRVGEPEKDTGALFVVDDWTALFTDRALNFRCTYRAAFSPLSSQKTRLLHIVSQLLPLFLSKKHDFYISRRTFSPLSSQKRTTKTRAILFVG